MQTNTTYTVNNDGSVVIVTTQNFDNGDSNVQTRNITADQFAIRVSAKQKIVDTNTAELDALNTTLATVMTKTVINPLPPQQI